MNALLQTWEISSRINEFLLNGTNEEYLNDISAGKGRNAGEQFAHIHNVRLMWLQASTPDLMASISKLEKGAPLSKDILIDSLSKSAIAISQLLTRAFAAGKVKGFKPSPEAFLGYLIAHEAHHRGQIILTLKENGHVPDKKVLFGLWEWGVR